MAVAKNRMPSWAIAFIIIIVLGVLSLPVFAIIAAILVPNFIHARAEAQISLDEQNIKHLATALEMYAVDNRGAYPASLKPLAPEYITEVPTVPQSGGAYVYRRTPGDKKFGPYTIADDGSANPAILRTLPKGPGGPPCAYDCKRIVYGPASGIVGAP